MENYDSRDMQERIEELEEIAEQKQDEHSEKLTQEENEELKALLELKEECEGMGWEHGIYFIHVYNFEEYAEELMDDCYEIPENLQNYIDYKAFARDLEMDYSEVKFRGEDYYYREA